MRGNLKPPPFAEGARGWVSLDSIADIADKDFASVIASKTQDLRGTTPLLKQIVIASKLQDLRGNLHFTNSKKHIL
ncbi:hypothetical protein [Helicobacter sp. T3_23-1056]